MAFASTTNAITVMGNKRVAFGEYTQVSGDTGGAIATGLGALDFFQATAADTVSVSGGTATITTADPLASVTGYWMAIGG